MCWIKCFGKELIFLLFLLFLAFCKVGTEKRYSTCIIFSLFSFFTSEMSDTVEETRLEDIANFEYDVFIIFATEDEPLARQVCEGLERNNKRCIAQFKHEAFSIGQNVFDNVVKNVAKSKATLLLLTAKSMESHWVTLETILALEESTRSNKLRLRLLLYNVTETEINRLKRGVLSAVPPVKLDLNKDDWSQELAREISSM